SSQVIIPVIFLSPTTYASLNSVWNQVCKDSGSSPVSVSSLNGDSIPMNIALALDSGVHRNLVQYLDNNRRACIESLLDGSGESQITISNLCSDCTCVVYFPLQSAAIRRLTIGDDRQDQNIDKVFDLKGSSRIHRAAETTPDDALQIAQNDLG
ncbi:hypothetical protein BVRB_023450, partial [Beta vulgaris subsp. vulgaris]